MNRYPNEVPTIIGLASNVKGGINPPFTITDFAEIYPQFFTVEYVQPKSRKKQCKQVPIIPESVINTYIELAHACVKESRFRESWKVCMGLFVAHFITLYLETAANPEGSNIAKAGQAGGLMSSKSVDGVSVSYDYSQVMNDLEGWADWKSTAYGVQLATWAKMFSLGGMYIH